MWGIRSLRKLRIEGEEKRRADVSWDQLEGSLIDRIMLRNLSPQYRQFLRQFIKPWREALGDVNPAGITVKELQSCILRWMKSSLKTRTINHRIRCIKILFNHAMKEGLIKENPTEKLEMQKENAEPIQAFSNDQVRSFLAQPDKTTFVGYRDYCMGSRMIRCGFLPTVEEALVEWTFSGGFGAMDGPLA